MARRFRKVYIICRDNEIFSDLTQITIYKHRDSADFAIRRVQEKSNEELTKLWNANKPAPKYKVHGFYLVHEDLFRE